MAKKCSMLIMLLLIVMCSGLQAQKPHGKGHGRDHFSLLSGKITSSKDGSGIMYASVYLKNTKFGCSTDDKGIYHLKAPVGTYTLIVSSIGFKSFEQKVTIKSDGRTVLDIVLTPSADNLEEVTISTSAIQQLEESAYNAVGIDTKALQNSTQNLSEALRQAPGMKLRESGGVGSDMQMMMDGFSGKHIKVFIDGVPQEGVGNSFGLNNIPTNFAERIEVYRGVVPVGFGADAIGGVINVVTKKTKESWFLDASYSYGSFNTHKSYVDFGQRFKNGLTYEINVFQNYSDNSYKIDATGVKHFLEGGGSRQNSQLVERVKRFHDGFHNEAVIGKIGIVDKSWADRLMFTLNYSQSYKEIQTDARQMQAFGERHRKGWSLIPSVEYRKHDLFVKGLDFTATGNYTRNFTENIDTSAYEYNWLGEKRLKNGRLGEVSYQDTKANNDNWNFTATANYHFAKFHTIILNNVTNTQSRETRTVTVDASNDINKVTTKNITGLSYRYMPNEKWNATLFSKYYNQYNSGPMADNSSSNTTYSKVSNNTGVLGYGTAATYRLKLLQAKLSYEKACRLPTNEELFGDNDLERGKFELKPERSDNVNLNLNWSKQIKKGNLFLEGGLIYRYTKDYIKRTTENVSGTYYGAYSNHGSVKTKGVNVAARYSYSDWFSIGGNFTQMDVRDDEEFQDVGSQQKNLSYGSRMPNQPYQFANADMSFYIHNLLKKGNILTVTYDNLYTHSFPLFSEAYGNSSQKMEVPSQFSHNLIFTYSMEQGRYNISFECHNLTNAQLYDNFNLQKAGRAFYIKLRMFLGRK